MRRGQRFFVMALTTCLFSSPSQAQEHRGVPGSSYTLQQLKELAAQHNPTLRQAEQMIRGEEGKAVQAGLWPNPTIGYQGEQIGQDGTAGEFQGGFIEQRIVLGGKLSLSRQKYEARTEAARRNLESQRYRVNNDVESSFYEALGSEAKLSLYDDLLNNAKDHYKTTMELVNIGRKTRAELKLVEIELQKARLERFMAEKENLNQHASLEAVVGAPLPHSKLVGNLEDETAKSLPDWESLLAQTLEKSPQVLAALEKLRSDEITVEREEAEPIPDLVLRGGAGYNSLVHQTVYLAGLNLKIPLFDQNQGTIQQAEADLERQKAEVDRLRLLLSREFAREYSMYLTRYQKALKYQSSIVPNARQAYEMRLAMYKDQRINWSEVLETQKDYLSDRLEWVDELVEYHRHRVAVTGFLLKDGLQVPDSPTPPSHIDAVPKPR